MIRFQWGSINDPIFKEAAALRIHVFIEEQHFEYDLDDLDKTAEHLGVYNDAGEIVGAARVMYLPDHVARAGRICTRADVRGQGVGAAMMAEIEAHCKAEGVQEIILGAQERVKPFYEKAGFIPYGDPYDEEGCPHIHMKKALNHEKKVATQMKTYGKIGIIGAMQVETDAILPYLSNPTEKKHASISFIEGTLGTTTVILATSGIGKVQAACTAQILIDQFQVECIINTGIAGGIAPFLKTCDVVIANQLVYHDYFVPEPDLTPFLPEPSLVEALETLGKTTTGLENTHFYTGKIATGDQFVQSSEEKQRLTDLCDPLCVEMEGAAIGNCCTINGVNFAVIRAISDSADEDAEDTYEKLKTTSAHIAGTLVTSLIRQIQK